MKIYLDNIIFSLQNTGGISVVWKELIQRMIDDSEFNLCFIENKNHNIFREQISIQEKFIQKNPLTKIPISIQRFLNPNELKGKGIFHSSYYRITNNPNFINITTVHDFTYEHYRKGLAKHIHSYQKGRAINKSKRIICISENTKKDLLRFYPNIKSEQITVVHNGVGNIYQPLLNKDEIILNTIIPFSSGEYVLYVGDRKSLYKNFILAVKACQITNQPLVMVGGGVLTGKETSMLAKLLGENNFKQLNGINDELLNVIYNHAFCLLYPSLYEGFGIPILEAQKVGCPVICSDGSSIPEVAGNGAILINEITEFKVGEALNLLKKDNTFLNQLKLNGFNNSNLFSWDKCYQQTKEVYKEVYQIYLK